MHPDQYDNRNYNYNTPQTPAPPLGITPKGVWRDKMIRERTTEILQAIDRYQKAGKSIPDEWLAELNEHLGVK